MSNTSWRRPCFALKPCLQLSLQIRTAAAFAGVHHCRLSDPPIHLAQCRLCLSKADLLSLRRLPGRWSAVRQHHPRSTHVYCQQRDDSADSQTHRNRASRSYDAVVVLGGGLTPAAGIPTWGQRRLQKALLLYKQASEDACVWLPASYNK